MPTETINADLQIVPDPLQPNFQILIKRNNREGIMGLFVTDDGGKTTRSLVPAPTKNDRPGSTLTIKADGSVGWVLDPVVEYTAAQRTAAGLSGTRRNLIFVDFEFSGEVFANASFGYFRVPKSSNFRCVEVQVSIQAVGDTPIKIDLLNGSDTVQNCAITLKANIRRQSLPLPTPVIMVGNSVWSAKILQCGTVAPGEHITYRLVLEPF